MKNQKVKKQAIVMLWGRLGGKEEEEKVIDAIKTITGYPKKFIKESI